MNHKLKLIILECIQEVLSEGMRTPKEVLDVLKREFGNKKKYIAYNLAAWKYFTPNGQKYAKSLREDASSETAKANVEMIRNAFEEHPEIFSKRIPEIPQGIQQSFSASASSSDAAVKSAAAIELDKTKRAAQQYRAWNRQWRKSYDSARRDRDRERMDRDRDEEDTMPNPDYDPVSLGFPDPKTHDQTVHSPIYWAKKGMKPDGKTPLSPAEISQIVASRNAERDARYNQFRKDSDRDNSDLEDKESDYDLPNDGDRWGAFK